MALNTQIYKKLLPAIPYILILYFALAFFNFSKFYLTHICLSSFLIILTLPSIILSALYDDYINLKEYLNSFKPDNPACVAIILANTTWKQWKTLFAPSYTKGEIEILVQLLEHKRQKFSFYTDLTLEDVEKIMADKNIKEVYFVGHGKSYFFRLSPKQEIHYSEFSDISKYGKDFVHQLHCGTKYGKNLVEYVVPKENQDKCIFYRKKVSGGEIEEDLKDKLYELKGLRHGN